MVVLWLHKQKTSTAPHLPGMSLAIIAHRLPYSWCACDPHRRSHCGTQALVGIHEERFCWQRASQIEKAVA